MGKQQGGFSVVEIILSLVIIGIVGFVGYRVYEAYQRPEPAKEQDTSQNQPEPEPEPVDPTASWKTYTSKTGKFSLKHPADWSTKVCDKTAENFSLSLGTTKSTSANCDGSRYAQITVFSTTAVPTASEQQLDPEFYTKRTTEKVTVDGVKGTRRTGVLKNPAEGLASEPVGMKAVTYIFLKPGHSYIIVYVQKPSGAYAVDNLEEFDLMVKETLKFTK